MIELIQPSSEFITAIKHGMKSRYAMIAKGNEPSISRDSADVITEDDQHLASLLNLSFWASIAKEEGRSVSGTICICTPEEYVIPIQFEHSVPLTLSKLVELLLVAGSSFLGVQWGSDGLEAWGFLLRPPYHRLNLRLTDNGSLIAIYDSNILAALTNGEVVIPRNKLPQNTLADFIAEQLYPNEKSEQRLPRAFKLLKLVSHISQFGHGGTLVVVASNNREWGKAQVLVKLNNDGSERLQQIMMQTETAQAEADEAYRSIMQGDLSTKLAFVNMMRIDSAKELGTQTHKLLFKVSELSKLDGAVIDERFVVYGFGAKLKATPPTFTLDSFDLLSGIKKSLQLNEIGGTRHQSAAMFVQQHQDVFVFALSQDGTVSLFCWAKTEKTLLMITGIETLLWEF